MLPDPIHLQTTSRQDQLLREATANRIGRPHVDDPRIRTFRLPSVLRRHAGARPVAA